jgi:hypothetical protein
MGGNLNGLHRLPAEMDYRFRVIRIRFNIRKYQDALFSYCPGNRH